VAYTVELSNPAKKDLAKLSPENQIRITKALRKLAQDPRPMGVEKLQGEQNAYRIRVGDYRVLYEIHDTVLLVLVFRVRHRKEVYRDL
jgi:mRNA interferase RelE/StbE